MLFIVKTGGMDGKKKEITGKDNGKQKCGQ